MSKHERQHSITSTGNNMTLINENPVREAKRARLESENPSPNSNWSTTLYVNTKIKDEQHTGFSSCFLTDKLLMPDTKKSQQEKSE